ncbi:RES family NAD+ phosphorylase [Salinivibrio sharmensis]|uniref:RES domain-containing protein n=1 Tax=Salinivibrio sharmensis TaxID=390883 RepID=A0ABX3KKY7_9GAMM|nr:RES family NAD+ phosphorylase [Salinivibrio sharmensis]OOE90867.1 hypothetical protein BZG74_01145 [Salinivibrio sharmensis]
MDGLEPQAIPSLCRTPISGIFVRVCHPEHIDAVLMRGSKDRPNGRYNCQGESALYLTETAESARVAMQKYASQITTPRVLVRYQVDPCELVDLRHPELQQYKTLSSVDWQAALAKGESPSSWWVADTLRSGNEIGLIDPSRKDPSTWHITLFRWNAPGAPSVTRVGEPEEISLK